MKSAISFIRTAAIVAAAILLLMSCSQGVDSLSNLRRKASVQTANSNTAVYVPSAERYVKSGHIDRGAEVYTLKSGNFLIPVTDERTGKQFALTPVMYRNSKDSKFDIGFVFNHCLNRTQLSASPRGGANVIKNGNLRDVDPSFDYCKY